MNNILIVFVLIFSHFILLGQEDIRPKNIILMIGDGMGLTQSTAAMYSQEAPLHLESFKHIGLMKTHSSSSRVTDSAAAGTALATGVKTYNGGIGVNSDTLPVQSILEELNLEGFKTGLVATCFIAHATPAAFFAHQRSRDMYEEISAELLSTDIDIFIAGGSDHFNNRKSDQRNLIQELKDKGYSIVSANGEKELSVEYLDLSAVDKLGYFTDFDHPRKFLDGRNWLPQATQFSLEFLKSKSEKGFFIMIEGSQIDWAGHDNDSRHIIGETLDFDQAVGKALDFVKNDGETLLIVLADHETGGMGINSKGKANNLDIGWTTTGHTATMVPVFSYGPGAENFTGIFDNTDVYKRMRMLLLGR